MLIVFEVLFLLITLLNSFAHSTGFALLKELYRNGKDTPQLLYIMNLSICEAVKNLTLFVTLLLHMVTRYATLSESSILIIMKVQVHLVMLGTMVFIMYYILMIYVTIDRLLEVYLSLKYPIYVNIVIATRQLKVTWFMCIVVLIFLSIQYEVNGFKGLFKYDLYIFLGLDLLYLVIAVITYTYLFVKFKNTRGTVRITNKVLKKDHVGTFKVFRQSRFYVSVLLVSSFLFLFVIPDLIASFVNFHKVQSIILLISLFICNGISDFCNAIVYIFIQRPVKQLLIKKCNAFMKRKYGDIEVSCKSVTLSLTKDVRETKV